MWPNKHYTFQTQAYSAQHQGFSLSLVLAAFMAIFGIMALLGGVMSQQVLPKTSLAAASAPTEQVAAGDKPAHTLPRSVPVGLEIPAIDIKSEMIDVGLNVDGTVEVPKGENYDKAAWYKYSVTPGEQGSTVILGHVDSVHTGPSVFFRLAELKPGDLVHVQRADKKTITYKVNRVAEYAIEDFPTKDVYNINNQVALRLVTCGGTFNRRTLTYESNIIVFASFHETDAHHI
ncbi:MAG: class F sortase [bacterium]|nr:class F sortase [bacterium]